jgi:Two component regulator propeller
MNRQLLEPTIASHISGTSQWCVALSVRLIIGLFAVSLFATAAFALDPQKAITQFLHRAWTEKDGAPADIFAITQTNDGYLWLGTPSGLFCFDGVRFSRFDPRNGEDLLAKKIRSLLATRDGSLWVVFNTGKVSCDLLSVPLPATILILHGVSAQACEPGYLDPASSIHGSVGTIPIYLDLPTGRPKRLCGGRNCQMG